MHGCVCVSQGKWEIRGVGRGAHGDRETAHVRCAVTPRTMPTAAVNATSLLLRGRNFLVYVLQNREQSVLFYTLTEELNPLKYKVIAYIQGNGIFLC